MPRNAAGTYTLPQPPVVTNTTITSNFENTTDADIATELTNSLDRNGRGGMLAPFKFFDGTQAAPGAAFTQEPGSGLYRIGPGDIAFSVLGTKVLEMQQALVSFPVGVNFVGGIVIGGTLQMAPGASISMGGAGAQLILSAAQYPSLTFQTDLDTGIGWIGNDTYDLLAGSAMIVRIQKNSGVSADGLTITSFAGAGPTLQPISNPRSIALRGTTNDGTANSVVFQRLDGFQVGFVRNDGVGQFNGGVVVTAGNRYWIDGGVDTFIVEAAPDIIGLFAGGVESARFGANITMNQSTTIAQTKDFNLAGSAASNFGRMNYSSAGNTTLTIDNAFDDANAQIRLRTRTNGVAVNCLILSGASITANSGTHVKSVNGTNCWLLNGVRYMKASPNANYNAPGGPVHEFETNDVAGNEIILMRHTGAVVNQQYGITIQLVGDPNNASNFFLNGTGGITARFKGMSNGGLHNFSANNVNLSDLTVKDYWEPYTVPQLEALSSAVDLMDFGRYKYKDQTHDDWNHGYVAQNVRSAFGAVAPELVDWWEEDKKDLLAVYGTDLVNIHLAVARHEISKLKADVALLRGLLNA